MYRIDNCNYHNCYINNHRKQKDRRCCCVVLFQCHILLIALNHHYKLYYKCYGTYCHFYPFAALPVFRIDYSNKVNRNIYKHKCTCCNCYYFKCVRFFQSVCSFYFPVIHFSYVGIIKQSRYKVEYCSYSYHCLSCKHYVLKTHKDNKYYR